MSDDERLVSDYRATGLTLGGFQELSLHHGLWSKPQCRMPDYAECIWAPELGNCLLAIRTSVPLILIRHSPFIYVVHIVIGEHVRAVSKLTQVSGCVVSPSEERAPGHWER